MPVSPLQAIGGPLRCLVIAMLAGMVVDAGNACAQVAVDVGSGVGRLGTDPWVRESRIAPSFRVAAAPGFLQLEGAMLERAGALSLRSAGLAGALSSPAFGPLRFSLAGNVASDSTATSLRVSTRAATTALSARFRSSGAWLGAAAQQRAGPALTVGAWQILGSAVLSLSTVNRALAVARMRIYAQPGKDTMVWNDTAQVLEPRTIGGRADTVRESQHRLASDMEARVDWGSGRLMLTAVVGHRSATRDFRETFWGGANAIVQMAPRVALLAGVGSAPAVRESLAPARRYATLGVRLSPAARLRPVPPAPVRPVATGLTVARATEGGYRLALRVPGARTVEISGDFNGWQPVSLHESSPNVWEAVLPLTPGTYRINVRVDGDRWTAPPGVSTVDDEFNGRVGIVVIP